MTRSLHAKDWKALFTTMKAVFDWTFDIGIERAREYPDDVESIETVRAFFHAWLDGLASEVTVADLIVTAATIFAELEVDCGIDSAALLQPLLDASVAVLRVPGMARDREPTLQIPRVSIERPRASGSAALRSFSI